MGVGVGSGWGTTVQVFLEGVYNMVYNTKPFSSSEEPPYWGPRGREAP